MIISAIILLVVNVLITVYYLVNFIPLNQLVNSVQFVEIAKNPFNGVETMKKFIYHRDSLYIMIAVTVISIVALVCAVYAKRKWIPKLKEAKKAREEEQRRLMEEWAKHMEAAPQAQPNMQFCRHCGAPLAPGAVFCAACGKTQTEENKSENAIRKTCIHCGAELEEGRIFCGSCGKKQEEPEKKNDEVKTEDVIEKTEAIKEEIVEFEEEGNTCIHCGAILEKGRSFCASCGKSQTPIVSGLKKTDLTKKMFESETKE